MICPKCGFVQPQNPECARCGVIVSRYRGPVSSAPGTSPAPPPLPSSPPPPVFTVGTVFGDPAPAASSDFAEAGTVYSPPPGGGTVYQGPAPGTIPRPGVVTTAGPIQTLRVGETLNEAFAVFGKNIIPFSILAAVAFSPIYLFAGFLTQRLAVEHPAAASWGNALVALVTLVLCIPLSTATITYGVFQQLRGRDTALGSCLSVGLSSLLPVLSVVFLQLLYIFGAVIVAAIAVRFLIGMVAAPGTRSAAAWALMLTPLFLLSYVAAFMVWIRFFVAVPAAVEERPGAAAALRRSAFLTEGQRWRILGLALVLIVFNLGIQYAAGKVPVAGPVLQPLLGLLSTALFATTCAVVYYRLRSFHESIDVDQIASVFA